MGLLDGLNTDRVRVEPTRGDREEARAQKLAQDVAALTVSIRSILGDDSVAKLLEKGVGLEIHRQKVGMEGDLTLSLSHKGCQTTLTLGGDCWGHDFTESNLHTPDSQRVIGDWLVGTFKLTAEQIPAKTVAAAAAIVAKSGSMENQRF